MTHLYSPLPPDGQDESETLQQLKTVLASQVSSHSARLVSGNYSVPLPESVVALLLNALQVMTEGKAVSLVPVSTELTTTRAAKILNVSRPYLTRLLDDGAIPYHQVGSHRRIQLDDLLAFKSQHHARQEEGLQKLTDFSQEHGLYALDSDTVAIEI